MGTFGTVLVVLGGLGVILWLLSTVAEALFGMPRWMQRNVQQQALTEQVADEIRLATNAEYMQRMNAGEQPDWNEIFQRKMQEHPLVRD
jgi:hypothetical protein